MTSTVTPQSPTPAARLGSTRLDDIHTRKLTLLEKAQNFVYSLVGLHLGQLVVYGLYSLLFLSTYRFFGYDFSLENAWTNLPAALHLTSALSWVPVGGPDGLGAFISGNWDFIQHSYFLKIPVGIVGFVFVGLLLSKTSKKELGPPNLIDRVLVRCGFANRHQGQIRGADHERTSFLQYAFLLPAMLIASLPGVIGGSILIYGGGALLHKFGGNTWFGHPEVWHPAFTDAYLTGTTWQPIAIGSLGAWFWGRKVTTKPAEDQQLFWLEERLWIVQVVNDVMDRVEAGACPAGSNDREVAMDTVTHERNISPSKLQTPVYKLRFEALEALVMARKLRVPNHGKWARYAMRFALGVFVLLVIWGGYRFLWFPKHGGLSL